MLIVYKSLWCEILVSYMASETSKKGKEQAKIALEIEKALDSDNFKNKLIKSSERNSKN